MPPVGNFGRGKANILSLASIGFLTISLISIVSFTNNPLKNIAVNLYARVSPDANVRRAERAGAEQGWKVNGKQCSGSQCLDIQNGKLQTDAQKAAAEAVKKAAADAGITQPAAPAPQIPNSFEQRDAGVTQTTAQSPGTKTTEQKQAASQPEQPASPGYSHDQVVNSVNNTPNTVGYDAGNGSVSGYYESNGRYFAIGGTGNNPATYEATSLAAKNVSNVNKDLTALNTATTSDERTKILADLQTYIAKGYITQAQYDNAHSFARAQDVIAKINSSTTSPANRTTLLSELNSLVGHGITQENYSQIAKNYVTQTDYNSLTSQGNCTASECAGILQHLGEVKVTPAQERAGAIISELQYGDLSKTEVDSRIAELYTIADKGEISRDAVKTLETNIARARATSIAEQALNQTYQTRSPAANQSAADIQQQQLAAIANSYSPLSVPYEYDVAQGLGLKPGDPLAGVIAQDPLVGYAEIKSAQNTFLRQCGGSAGCIQQSQNILQLASSVNDPWVAKLMYDNPNMSFAEANQAGIQYRQQVGAIGLGALGGIPLGASGALNNAIVGANAFTRATAALSLPGTVIQAYNGYKSGSALDWVGYSAASLAQALYVIAGGTTTSPTSSSTYAPTTGLSNTSYNAIMNAAESETYYINTANGPQFISSKLGSDIGGGSWLSYSTRIGTTTPGQAILAPNAEGVWTWTGDQAAIQSVRTPPANQLVSAQAQFPEGNIIQWPSWLQNEAGNVESGNPGIGTLPSEPFTGSTSQSSSIGSIGWSASQPLPDYLNPGSNLNDVWGGSGINGSSPNTGPAPSSNGPQIATLQLEQASPSIPGSQVAAQDQLASIPLRVNGTSPVINLNNFANPSNALLGGAATALLTQGLITPVTQNLGLTSLGYGRITISGTGFISTQPLASAYTALKPGGILVLEAPTNTQISAAEQAGFDLTGVSNNNSGRPVASLQKPDSNPGLTALNDFADSFAQTPSTAVPAVVNTPQFTGPAALVAINNLVNNTAQQLGTLITSISIPEITLPGVQTSPQTQTVPVAQPVEVPQITVGTTVRPQAPEITTPQGSTVNVPQIAQQVANVVRSIPNILPKSVPLIGNIPKAKPDYVPEGTPEKYWPCYAPTGAMAFLGTANDWINGCKGGVDAQINQAQKNADVQRAIDSKIYEIVKQANPSWNDEQIAEYINENYDQLRELVLKYFTILELPSGVILVFTSPSEGPPYFTQIAKALKAAQSLTERIDAINEEIDTLLQSTSTGPRYWFLKQLLASLNNLKTQIDLNWNKRLVSDAASSVNRFLDFVESTTEGMQQKPNVLDILVKLTRNPILIAIQNLAKTTPTTPQPPATLVALSDEALSTQLEPLVAQGEAIEKSIPVNASNEEIKAKYAEIAKIRTRIEDQIKLAHPGITPNEIIDFEVNHNGNIAQRLLGRASGMTVQTQPPAAPGTKLSQEEAFGKIITDTENKNISPDTLLSEFDDYSAGIKNVYYIRTSDNPSNAPYPILSRNINALYKIGHRIIQEPSFSTTISKLSGPDDPRVNSYPSIIRENIATGRIPELEYWPEDPLWIRYSETVKKYEEVIKDPSLLESPDNISYLKSQYTYSQPDEITTHFKNDLDSGIRDIYFALLNEARTKVFNDKLVTSGDWLGHGTFISNVENMLANGGKLKSAYHVLNSGQARTDITGSIKGGDAHQAFIFFFDWNNFESGSGRYGTFVNDKPVISNIGIFFPIDTIYANGLSIGSYLGKDVNSEFFVTKSPEIVRSSNGKYLSSEEIAKVASNDQTELPLDQAYFRVDGGTIEGAKALFAKYGYSSEWIDTHLYFNRLGSTDADFRVWLASRPYDKVAVPLHKPIDYGGNNFLWEPVSNTPQPPAAPAGQTSSLPANVESLVAQGEALRGQITPSMSQTEAQPLEAQITKISQQIDGLLRAQGITNDQLLQYKIDHNIQQPLMGPASGQAPQQNPPQTNALTSQDIVNAAQKNIVFDQKFVTDYFDILIKAGIAKKNENGTYVIDPGQIRLNDYNLDLNFLAWAGVASPDLQTLISVYQDSYFEALKTGVDIDAEQQQIFINRLLESHIFFTVEGNQANFEEYLKSVYGNTVKIIRVEQSLLTESEQPVLNQLRDDLYPESYAKLNSWIRGTQITKVIIGLDGREVTIPIISATIPDENINAFALPLEGTDLNPIVINTKLKSRSLFGTLRTVAHEIDHAIRRLRNPSAMTGEDKTTQTTILDYFFPPNQEKPYGSDDREALVKVLVSGMKEANGPDILISETGGETASLRLLDSMINGMSKFGAVGQKFAGILSISRYDHMLRRAIDIGVPKLTPYSIGSNLGDAITKEYGMEKLLEIIHVLSTSEAIRLLQPAVDTTTTYLTQQKLLTRALFDLGNQTSEFETSPTKVMEEAQQSATQVAPQTNVTQAAVEQIQEIPERLHLAGQIGEQMPTQILNILDLTNMAETMVQYLSDKNVVVKSYLLRHPDAATSMSAQTKADLMPHVDILFTIFNRKPVLSESETATFKQIVLTEAIARTVKQFNPELLDAERQLSTLLTSYGYEPDSKFSGQTGQSLAIPTMTDANGNIVLDKQKFNELLDRVRIEAIILSTPGADTVYVNLMDTPTPEGEFQRFKDTFLVNYLEFPFKSLEDVLKQAIQPILVESQSLALPDLSSNRYLQKYLSKVIPVDQSRLEALLAAVNRDLKIGLQNVPGNVASLVNYLISKTLGPTIELSGPTAHGFKNADVNNLNKTLFVSNITKGILKFDGMTAQPNGTFGIVDLVLDNTLLPFANNSVGCFLGSCLIKGIVSQTLLEAYRALEPGGIFVLENTSPEYITEANKIGFTTLDVSSPEPGTVNVVLQKPANVSALQPPIAPATLSDEALSANLEPLVAQGEAIEKSIPVNASNEEVQTKYDEIAKIRTQIEDQIKAVRPGISQNEIIDFELNHNGNIAQRLLGRASGNVPQTQPAATQPQSTITQTAENQIPKQVEELIHQAQGYSGLNADTQQRISDLVLNIRLAQDQNNTKAVITASDALAEELRRIDSGLTSNLNLPSPPPSAPSQLSAFTKFSNNFLDRLAIALDLLQNLIDEKLHPGTLTIHDSDIEKESANNGGILLTENIYPLPSLKSSSSLTDTQKLNLELAIRKAIAKQINDQIQQKGNSELSKMIIGDNLRGAVWINEQIKTIGLLIRSSPDLGVSADLWYKLLNSGLDKDMQKAFLRGAEYVGVINDIQSHFEDVQNSDRILSPSHPLTSGLQMILDSMANPNLPKARLLIGVDGVEPNAYTYGYNIFINLALIKRMRSIDEIAAFLAHEQTHFEFNIENNGLKSPPLFLGDLPKLIASDRAQEYNADAIQKKLIEVQNLTLPDGTAIEGFDTLAIYRGLRRLVGPRSVQDIVHGNITTRGEAVLLESRLIDAEAGISPVETTGTLIPSNWKVPTAIESLRDILLTNSISRNFYLAVQKANSGIRRELADNLLGILTRKSLYDLDKSDKPIAAQKLNYILTYEISLARQDLVQYHLSQDNERILLYNNIPLLADILRTDPEETIYTFFTLEPTLQSIQKRALTYAMPIYRNPQILSQLRSNGLPGTPFDAKKFYGLPDKAIDTWIYSDAVRALYPDPLIPRIISTLTLLLNQTYQRELSRYTRFIGYYDNRQNLPLQLISLISPSVNSGGYLSNQATMLITLKGIEDPSRSKSSYYDYYNKQSVLSLISLYTKEFFQTHFQTQGNIKFLANEIKKALSVLDESQTKIDKEFIDEVINTIHGVNPDINQDLLLSLLWKQEDSDQTLLLKSIAGRNEEEFLRLLNGNGKYIFSQSSSWRFSKDFVQFFIKDKSAGAWVTDVIRRGFITNSFSPSVYIETNRRDAFSANDDEFDKEKRLLSGLRMIMGIPVASTSDRLSYIKSYLESEEIKQYLQGKDLPYLLVIANELGSTPSYRFNGLEDNNPVNPDSVLELYPYSIIKEAEITRIRNTDSLDDAKNAYLEIVNLGAEIYEPIYGTRNQKFLGNTIFQAQWLKQIHETFYARLTEEINKIDVRTANAISLYSLFEDVLPETAEKRTLLISITRKFIDVLPNDKLGELLTDLIKRGRFDKDTYDYFVNQRLHTEADFNAFATYRDSYIKGLISKGDTKVGGLVIADTALDVIVNDKLSLDLFEAMLKTNESDTRLKELLYWPWFVGTQVYGAANGYELILDNGEIVVTGEGKQNYISFDDFYNALFNSGTEQRIYILNKLLTGPNGVLTTRSGRLAFARLVSDKLPKNDPLSKTLVKVLNSATRVLDEARLFLGFVQPLSDMILQNPPQKSPNTDAGKIIYQNLKNLHGTVWNIFWEGKFKLSDKNVDASSLDRFITRNEQLTPTVSSVETLRIINGFIDATERHFDLPTGLNNQNITSSALQKNPDALDIVVGVAENLGAVGVRFLQVMVQYMDIPPEYQIRFRKVFDAVSGQDMFGAWDTIAKVKQYEASNLNPENRDVTQFVDHELVRIVKRLSGGSIVSVFLAEVHDKNPQTNVILPTTHLEVIKIRNPNAETNLFDTANELMRIIDNLATTDRGNASTYRIAARMINDIKEWVKSDIRDETFLTLDPIYAQNHVNFTATNGVKIRVVPALRPNSKDIKRELFIPGPTLNALMQIQADMVANGKTLSDEIQAAESSQDTELVLLLTNIQVKKITLEDFIKQINIAIAEDTARHIIDPTYKEPDNTLVHLVHSDIHPGNVIVGFDSSGNTIVYPIDRNLYLRLSSQDVEFFQQFLTDTNAADYQKLLRTVEYFSSFASDETKKNLNTRVLALAIGAKIKLLKENSQLGMLTIIMQEIEKQGIPIPLRVRIMFKNILSLEGMLRGSNLPTFSSFVQARMSKPQGTPEPLPVVDISWKDIQDNDLTNQSVQPRVSFWINAYVHIKTTLRDILTNIWPSSESEPPTKPNGLIGLLPTTSLQPVISTIAGPLAAIWTNISGAPTLIQSLLQPGTWQYGLDAVRNSLNRLFVHSTPISPQPPTATSVIPEDLTKVTTAPDGDPFISAETEFKAESSPALTRRVTDIQNQITNLDPQKVAQLIYDAKYIDGLTGLVNRTGFVEGLDLEIASFAKAGTDLTVITMDLKEFKKINDMLGHAIGDEALKTVAGILKRNSRSTDLVVRISGDEFALILPQTNEVQAQALMQRILTELADLKTLSDVNNFTRLININYAIKQWTKTDTVEAFLNSLDISMYEQKRNTGNPVPQTQNPLQKVLIWIKDRFNPQLGIIQPDLANVMNLKWDSLKENVIGWWLTRNNPVSYDDLKNAIDTSNKSGDQLLDLFESYVRTQRWKKESLKPGHYSRSSEYKQIWGKIVDQADFQLDVVDSVPQDPRWSRLSKLFNEAVSIDTRSGIDLNEPSTLDPLIDYINRKRTDTNALSPGGFFAHGTYSWNLPGLIQSGGMMSPNGQINAGLLQPSETPRLGTDHWSNGELFFYEFPNNNPGIVPGAYGQNQGPQGPGQETDIAVYLSSSTLVRYARYIGVDRMGTDEFWISNATNAPRDTWGMYGKNARDTKDDTTKIPIAELYFVIPYDIEAQTIKYFQEAGYSDQWLQEHLYVLHDFHSHKYGELPGTHNEAIRKNEDKILSWLKQNTKPEASSIQLELVEQSGQEYIYKPEIITKSEPGSGTQETNQISPSSQSTENQQTGVNSNTKSGLTGRVIDIRNQIERFFQYMQLSRVSLDPSAMVKIINNPSFTKPEDVIGLTYSVRGPDGTIVKTGQIIKDNSISLPTAPGYNLSVSEFTVTGADIFAQYPEYQTWSELEKIALNSLLIASILIFALGELTQSWTLADSIFKTHTSIYYFFKNVFGRGFANVVLGQFKDVATVPGMFALESLTTEMFARGIGRKILMFMLNIFAFGWIGLEFYQANLIGSHVDLGDILAFSLFPIATIIYFTYSLIRYVVLPKIDPANFRIDTLDTDAIKEKVSANELPQQKQPQPRSAFENFLTTNDVLIRVGVFGTVFTAGVSWLVTVMLKHHFPYIAYLFPAFFLFMIYNALFGLLKEPSAKQSITALTEFLRKLFHR